MIEDIDKESQATGDQQEKPEESDESPNNTGTAVKNTASCEPTPEFRGTRKRSDRLFIYFIFHADILS